VQTSISYVGEAGSAPQPRKPVVHCSVLGELLGDPGSATIMDRIRMASVGVAEWGQDEQAGRNRWACYDSGLRLMIQHGALGMPDAPDLPGGFQPSESDIRRSKWFVSKVVEFTPPDHVIYVGNDLVWEFERFILSGCIDCHSVSLPLEAGTYGDEFAINHWSCLEQSGVHLAQDWQLLAHAVLLVLNRPSLKRGKLRIISVGKVDRVNEVSVKATTGLADYLEGKINDALDFSLMRGPPAPGENRGIGKRLTTSDMFENERLGVAVS
jgi:hypothetical protein